MELNRKDIGLITFAVLEESRSFLRAWGNANAVRPIRKGPTSWRFPGLDVLVTGMGPRNARACIETFFRDHHPRWVVTAGFAGGLDPGCPRGMVGISSDPGFLDSLTANHPSLKLITFHESLRVIQTTAAKAKLHQETGCHAVDMESATIRRVCHVQGVPSATIRVISDDATEDLPLDFGALMGPDDRMDWSRLALTLLGSPSLIPRLIRFQSRLKLCADRLADTLVEVLGQLRNSSVTATHERAHSQANRIISN